MHEEPIVCSVDDAFRAFVSSKIDYLIVGKKFLAIINMNIVSIVSYDKNSGSGHLGRTIELSEFIKKKIKKSRSTFITNSRDAKYKLSKKKN